MNRAVKIIAFIVIGFLLGVIIADRCTAAPITDPAQVQAMEEAAKEEAPASLGAKPHNAKVAIAVAGPSIASPVPKHVARPDDAEYQALLKDRDSWRELAQIYLKERNELRELVRILEAKK